MGAQPFLGVRREVIPSLYPSNLWAWERFAHVALGKLDLTVDQQSGLAPLCLPWFAAVDSVILLAANSVSEVEGVPSAGR